LAGEETYQHPFNPSFHSLDPDTPSKERHFQAFDFQKVSASDALQVAIEPRRRFDDAANLLFAFRPEPHHCLALAVEVGLHVTEVLDDGLDPPVRY
jgi:hypothetical protein